MPTFAGFVLFKGYSNLKDFDYDLFVIGAGSGGVRACRIAASLGARVAVAEERYFGGTCVNVGCVPKKLFSYAAHYLDDLQDSRGFGWSFDNVSFDWKKLKENKDIEINRLNGIYKSILDKNQVQIFEARARIQGPHEIEVDGKIVTAKYILIAVGGWPWSPEFPGSQHVISSNEVFELEQLPEAITVIGGGYIAVEFASIFSRLGVETTLVYRGEQLLRGFDDEIREFISAEMSHSLNLKLSTDVSEITNKDNVLTVKFKDGDQLECNAVLSATGRRPMTGDLGLDSVNVKTSDTGAILVNDDFQTEEPSIYAVGDVIDRMALTPVALAEGQIVARALFSEQKTSMNYQNIATAVFCHPNIATVGLSESDALGQGHKVDIYTSKFKQLKHTLSGRDEMSMIKLVVDAQTDKLLGLHVVALDAGELVQGFAVAMNCGATKTDLDNTIGIHPTMAEELVTMREKR
ncbi:MAG: glutathione-disulfide reductase [SAR86 cluster bacterium]|uniref:Glutathione-disulfide reductase n=1 Tax=SAR86 cluster bacterium TaxID=2030880 RepID=A0A2A5B3F3_9GAMM|nr:MAG: glutathione-disulfide reductase [SAR86 cluster bacterium]